ncbi:excitatory amino acid transporter 3 isoform X2 [Cimex lectularius]|uniref:Amino acid transporter n=1 Tax=Cimex lectularius TaxID=79782 RepID=A0A8I6RXD3_CIMLE|nr:excitatory amino acid transporter 3 isoform X2 [Cimex lectularius]
MEKSNEMPLHVSCTDPVIVINLYDRTEAAEMEEPLRREPASSGACRRFFSIFKGNLLPILTVASVIGGIAFGLLLRFSSSDRWNAREVMYIQFPGELFLRMLKALIIPLLVSSITSAIGSLDLSLSKKIGGRAIAYYLLTTVIAVIEGIILVMVIQPGRGGDFGPATATEVMKRPVTTVDTLLDLIRNMFPPNLIQSCISQYRTLIIPPEHILPDNNDTKLWPITYEYTNNSNVLGLVIFAVVQGIAIGQLGNVGKPLLKFYSSLGESMMLITNWVIWLSPVGVFFLIAGKMVEAESFAAMIGQLGLYFLTVIIGLFVHGFITLPAIYFLGTRKLPFKFLTNMSQAIVTAFATGSSSASLSVSMSCLEEKNNIDPRVTRFVMPIGATVNMDGTALYEAVAVIFISQVRNYSLSLGQIIAVSISSTMASIGAASIPQAGLVTMVMVLDTVGLPAEDVTLIFAVDWLLDRFRTSINVIGDSLGAGIVAHLSKKELEKVAPVTNNRT